MRDSRFGGSDSPVVAAMGTVETPVDIELTMSRGGVQVRPMTETESNLMTQVLDLRRERAEALAEVDRLRGALDRVQQFETALRMPADHNIPPRYQQFIGNIRHAIADELRDVLRGDQ